MADADDVLGDAIEGTEQPRDVNSAEQQPHNHAGRQGGDWESGDAENTAPLDYQDDYDQNASQESGGIEPGQHEGDSSGEQADLEPGQAVPDKPYPQADRPPQRSRGHRNERKEINIDEPLKNGCCTKCLKAFSATGKACKCQVPYGKLDVPLGEAGCQHCGCRGCHPMSAGPEKVPGAWEKEIATFEPYAVRARKAREEGLPAPPPHPWDQRKEVHAAGGVYPERKPDDDEFRMPGRDRGGRKRGGRGAGQQGGFGPEGMPPVGFGRPHGHPMPDMPMPRGVRRGAGPIPPDVEVCIQYVNNRCSRGSTCKHFHPSAEQWAEAAERVRRQQDEFHAVKRGERSTPFRGGGGPPSVAASYGPPAGYDQQHGGFDAGYGDARDYGRAPDPYADSYNATQAAQYGPPPGRAGGPRGAARDTYGGRDSAPPAGPPQAAAYDARRDAAPYRDAGYDAPAGYEPPGPRRDVPAYDAGRDRRDYGYGQPPAQPYGNRFEETAYPEPTAPPTGPRGGRGGSGGYGGGSGPQRPQAPTYGPPGNYNAYPASGADYGYGNNGGARGPREAAGGYSGGGGPSASLLGSKRDRETRDRYDYQQTGGPSHSGAAPQYGYDEYAPPAAPMGGRGGQRGGPSGGMGGPPPAKRARVDAEYTQGPPAGGNGYGPQSDYYDDRRDFHQGPPPAAGGYPASGRQDGGRPGGRYR